MTEALKRANLRRYLIGETFLGRVHISGLLHRIDKRVQAMGEGWGPAGRDWPHAPEGSEGSIIGGGSGTPKQTDSENIDDCFELCLVLISYLGNGIMGYVSPRAERDLASYLARNSISDIYYLTAPTKGLIPRTKAKIANVLPHDRPGLISEQDRALDLARALTAWIGNCTHDYQEVPSETSDYQIHECRCGARYMTAKGKAG